MGKITVRETHPCRREMLIEVPPEAMEEELASVYKNIGQGCRIPGFRPGKAPRRVLEKYFQNDARSRTIESRLRRAYEEAVGENGLRVLGEPEFLDVDWTEGGPLNFKAAVEISPVVELKEYRGLELNRMLRPVEEADIDRVVEDLRERKAEYLTEPPRPSAAGDWALVDYLPPGQKDDRWVEGALIEISEDEAKGVGSQLIGLEPGQVREVTFPAGGGEKPDVQPPVFPVRLREIKKRVLPAADDEWARGWGEYAGLDELRKQVREDIARTRELQGRRELEGQAIEILLQGYDFPLPPAAFKQLVDNRLEEFRRMTPEPAPGDEKVPDEKLVAAVQREAEQELRLIFILREIARAEKLEVDPRALGEEVAGLARREGVTPARLREALEERGQVPVLMDRLLRRRALDFVIEQSRIKDQQGDN